MILAGDVGGTKIYLALYSFDDGKLKVERDEKFAAHQFSSLDDVVNAFLGTGSREDITAACFGCPGPVHDGRIQLTNLPWLLDSRDLRQSLKIEQIYLINDLEANGWGVPEIPPDKIYSLIAGDPSAVGHRGLIAAGTGLGEALMIWDGKIHRPIPSEGGHCDFAPRNEREDRLLAFLRGKLNGHVSWERVVSGIGLKNVYEFMRDVEKLDEPQSLRDEMAKEDPNAVIVRRAEDGSSEICVESVRLLCSAYGAEAGNIALKVLAMGGIYLGGGVAPKMLKSLSAGEFEAAFLDKGRLSPVLKMIPVRVILDETCALLGAAAYAESRVALLSGHSERAASINA